MATRDTTWPDGTPCWVDLAVTDLGETKRRYGHLLGWDTDDSPGGDDGYVICLKNGRAAAALMAMSDPETDSQWLVYLATADLAAAVERVRAAGGRVLSEPSEVGGGAGRLAVVSDPTGASFALWQGGTRTGFQIVGEPGSVASVGLLTRDLTAAQTFYAQVFGYVYEEVSPGLVRFATETGAPAVGQLHQAEHLPDDVAAAWQVAFGVASRDASVAMAEMEDDTDVLMSLSGPDGLEAVIRGAEGEIFSVLELREGQPGPAAVASR